MSRQDIKGNEEMKKKIYLQCGYEDECKNKDCLKCPKRKRHSLSLTHAEETVIEDFAMIDIQEMFKQERYEEINLMQNIMFKIMKKVFKEKKK